MKAVFTLAILFLLVAIFKGQSAAEPGKFKAKACTLSYANNAWTFIHTDSSLHKCGELVFLNLPPLDNPVTKIILDLKMKGQYNLKRDSSLQMPSTHQVTVEDQLTGQTFDLASSQPFPFSFNRNTGNARFVVSIKRSNSN